MRLPLLLAAAAGVVAARDSVVIGPLPAREQESCAVCNGPAGRKGKAYLVDGQRFAVMDGMEKQFLQEPMKYATRFRPENILFSGGSKGSASDMYLYAGLLVLVGLVIGGVGAHLLVLKRKPAWAAAAPGRLGKIPSTRSEAYCQGCGAANHPSAQACVRCGGEMQPTAPSELGALGTGS